MVTGKELAPVAAGRLFVRICVAAEGPPRLEGELEKTCCPEAGTG